MPRGPRILLNNAYYHIISRGNQKQKIFLEDSDFVRYMQILKSYKQKYAFKLFGYCLMPNHVHIILEPRKPSELSKFMQGLSQTYSVWFSKKYKKGGHLWQGRFKGMVIKKDEYFIDCICYVEVNPVRAGLVSTPADYPWSSYRDRAFANRNGLLDIPDST